MISFNKLLTNKNTIKK